MEQFIIYIITLIIQFLMGEFTIPTDPDRVFHLSSADWTCEPLQWTQAPRIENNQFKGQSELDCQVRGGDGGGIIALRRHMLSQIAEVSDKVHSGPNVENFEGLPSNSFDVTLALESESDVSYLRGNTHIATDGFTQIRNVFVSTQSPSKGQARYIRSVRSEVNVSPSEDAGWFDVKIIQSNSIRRPWYISSKTFKERVQQKMEAQMQDKKELIMNDLAQNL